MNTLDHTQSGDTLRYASPKEGTPSGLYKICIPAGTVSWRVGMQTGSLPVPISVVMSMDAPPNVAHAVEVGPDYRTVLQRLWAGATLRSDSPAHSGTLSVSSQPELGGSWRADRERWVYLQFDFGPYKCRSWQSHIVVNLAQAPAPVPVPTPVPVPVPTPVPVPVPVPAPHPVPSLALAGRTRDYAYEAGLADALKRTAGVRPDDDDGLSQWLLRQGDLWYSLCRMVSAAEQHGPAK